MNPTNPPTDQPQAIHPADETIGLPKAPAYSPDHAQTAQLAAGHTDSDGTDENPDKNYLVLLAISTWFGIVGGDRFYLNKNGTAILKLVTLGGLGIWALIDFILAVFGVLKAKDDDRRLQGYAKNRSWVVKTFIALVVFMVVYVLFIGFAFSNALNDPTLGPNPLDGYEDSVDGFYDQPLDSQLQ